MRVKTVWNVGEISEDEISLDSEEVKKAFQMNGPQMNVLFASLDEEDDLIKDILDRHNNWKKSVNIPYFTIKLPFLIIWPF